MTVRTDDIDAFVSSYDDASRYTTVQLLKDNRLERTELVEDATGKRYVRKFLQVEPEKKHPYELMDAICSPLLPRVVSHTRVGDRLIVVLEWVEGTTVEELYESQPPDLHRAQVIFDDVCSAVEVLHAAEGGPIIHRDINPSNVVFDGTHAHLIDFGIARRPHSGAHADTELWGTMGYAPPEQFGFGQSDERADVYAAGKLLHFLVTGEHPGQEAMQVAPGLARVLHRACAIEPDKRYSSISKLRRAADRQLSLLAQTGTSARAAVPLVQGLVDAYPLARGVWIAWCIAVWAFVALMVVGTADAFATGTQTAGPLAYMALDALVFGVPALCLTGVFGFVRRSSWLRVHRYRKLGGAVCLSVVLGFALIYVSGLA